MEYQITLKISENQKLEFKTCDKVQHEMKQDQDES